MKGGIFTPQTKFQDFIYTIIMALVMVYAMICYNVAFAMGGMSNKVFAAALGELPIMWAFAFVLEFFIVGKLAQKIAFKAVNPSESKPFVITLAISSVIVCIMCPIMSLIATLLFNFSGAQNVIADWLETTVRNFPMALCFQIFYAGPFVRLIFRTLFKKQLSKNSAENKQNK